MNDQEEKLAKVLIEAALSAKNVDDRERYVNQYATLVDVVTRRTECETRRKAMRLSHA